MAEIKTCVFHPYPPSHKREGPCDLKTQFANVQSLLVIKSPLKMCRACTFKCKYLKGLQTGERNTSARLPGRCPTSCPHEALCHHARTEAIPWLEGCASPEEPRGSVQAHGTPWIEGSWSPTTKPMGFGITLVPSWPYHSLAAGPSGSLHILSASASSAVL